MRCGADADDAFERTKALCSFSIRQERGYVYRNNRGIVSIAPASAPWLCLVVVSFPSFFEPARTNDRARNTPKNTSDAVVLRCKSADVSPFQLLRFK